MQVASTLKDYAENKRERNFAIDLTHNGCVLARVALSAAKRDNASIKKKRQGARP